LCSFIVDASPVTGTLKFIFLHIIILHNEKLHNLCTSPDIIRVIQLRRMIWAGHLTCMEEMTNTCKVSDRKPEGKRLLGRPLHRWENNI
jgi:hypothetical protein